MFLLEKELGVYIDENYPLMKYYLQLDNLRRYKEEEANQYKTNKGVKTLR